jgi:outer membrane protein TolC
MLRRYCRYLSGLLLLALLTAGASGCSRAWWRERTDREAYAAIDGKMLDPRWASPRVEITPHTASRMYDPYDPDCPPLPPDDPAAHRLMSRPGGFRGSREWDEFGHACFNENPHWMTPFPPVGDTSLEQRVEREIPADNRLTLEQLLELSYLHSREYQTQIENLYLAALDLTFDRYLFTIRTRGLSNREPGADLEYENVPSNQDNLRLDTRWGYRKLLPVGTQLAVELANSTLWMFSGPNQTNTMTIASYSIVQPLLLGAGRKIVLESLTQSERNVLYSARDLARFRQVLFVNTVSGNGGLLGLLQQRQQILNVESNIEELVFQVKVLTELQSRPPRSFETRLRATAQPLLRAAIPPELNGKLAIAQTATVGESTVDVEWTLPMTEQEATALEAFVEGAFGEDRATARAVLGQIRDDVIRPARDRQFVEFENPLPEALGIRPGDPLPGTFQYRVGLEERTANFADFAVYEQLESGDGYRIVWTGPMLLGQEDALLALVADPTFIAIVQRLAVTTRARQSLQTNQLQTQLFNQRNNLLQFQRAYRDALDRYKIDLGLPPDVLLPIDECLLKEFELIDTRISNASALDDTELGLEQRLLDFVNVVYSVDPEAPRAEAVRGVLEQLQQLHRAVGEQGLAIVRGDLADLRGELAAIRGRLPGPLERERLQRDFEIDLRRFQALEGNYAQLSRGLDVLAVQLGADVVAPERVAEIANDLRSIREELLKLVRELKVIQIGARVEQIALQPFEIPLDEAVAVALENRVDLMNERAFVVDARRQVEITANRLKAILNIRAEGDIRNETRDENPFDFRGARSSYRVGVGFTAPLDRLAERNDYRASLIALQRAKRTYTRAEDDVKFQIRQNWRALTVLRENFEISRQTLRYAAAQLDQASESALEPLRPGQTRSATSSSGLDLLNALSTVLNAQNSIIRIWVDYESARLNLYRDMGIMNVDACGMWDDPFYQGLSQQCRRPISDDPTSGQDLPLPVPVDPDTIDPGVPGLLNDNSTDGAVAPPPPAGPAAPLPQGPGPDLPDPVEPTIRPIAYETASSEASPVALDRPVEGRHHGQRTPRDVPVPSPQAPVDPRDRGSADRRGGVPRLAEPRLDRGPVEGGRELRDGRGQAWPAAGDRLGTGTTRQPQ